MNNRIKQINNGVMQTCLYVIQKIKEYAIQLPFTLLNGIVALESVSSCILNSSLKIGPFNRPTVKRMDRVFLCNDRLWFNSQWV